MTVAHPFDPLPRRGIAEKSETSGTAGNDEQNGGIEAWNSERK
jgi:hypothetical protein